MAKDNKKKQAVQGKRGTIFRLDPDELVIIGLDTDDGPEHPLYDASIKRPLNEATVQDIMLRGVQHAVTGRKNGDRVEVVLGRDRTRHAREAKKRLLEKGVRDFRIKVEVKRYASDLDMRLDMRSENYHRRVIDAITRAKDMAEDERMGASDEALMIAYNLPNIPSVKKAKSYLDLDKEVQDSIRNGDISATEALRLVGLPREEQKVALKRKVVEKAVRKAAKAAGEMPKKAPDKDVIRAVATWPHMKPDVKAGILWAIGDIDSDQAALVIIGFGTALEDAKKVYKAPAEKAVTEKVATKVRESTKAEKAAVAAKRSW